MWSTDLHAAPIACNMELFEDVGVAVDARVDFSNCKYFKDASGGSICAKNKGLDVLKFDNWKGFGLDPCPALKREQFYWRYVGDPGFELIDFVICSHPAANCELYLPFDVSLVVYATTRLEFGRNDSHVHWRRPNIDDSSPARWLEWAETIVALAKGERNVIAANNAYDAAYIE